MDFKTFLVLVAMAGTISLPSVITEDEATDVSNNVSTTCQRLLRTIQRPSLGQDKEEIKAAINSCCQGLLLDVLQSESKEEEEEENQKRKNLALKCLLLRKQFVSRTKRSPLPPPEVTSRHQKVDQGQDIVITRVNPHNQHETLQTSSKNHNLVINKMSLTSTPVPTILNQTSSTASPCPDNALFHGSTIWSRIGTGPLLTALAIVIAILIYFIISSRERKGEHFYLFITILLSGFGNLGAGFVLSHVQNWKVFLVISQLLILEPTLLGLKGNIEMCMASRLATQANLGNMSTWKKTFTMIRGNLALDLTQATVVSFIAAIAVCIFSLIQGDNDLPFGYTLSIVLSACMLTACTASIILGSTLVTVIITSYKLKLDPDNIGAPVGASLGDVITLSLLAAFSVLVFNHTPNGQSDFSFPVVPFVIVLIILLLLPIWVYNAYFNEYTRSNLSTGWIPIFVAVVLSTASGFILDFAAHDFIIYSTFQPVMNGVGGNIVAIHASRMSTHLHKSGSDLGSIPNGVKMYRNPVKAFFDPTEVNVEMARNLVFMSIPAHILYLFITTCIKSNVTLTIPFLLIYCSCAIMQMVLLLYIAYHLVNMMWKSGIDPDNTVIPILTATGDFLGSLFLLISFLILRQISDVNGA